MMSYKCTINGEKVVVIFNQGTECSIVTIHHEFPPLVNVYDCNSCNTEREGRIGEYWPEVVAVRTERSEVRTNMTEGQYSLVRLELARLVNSLLYGPRAMFVLNFPAFENKKISSLWPFPRKRSVWRDPDQERTNQNAQICLAIKYCLIILNCDKHANENSLVSTFFSLTL